MQPSDVTGPGGRPNAFAPHDRGAAGRAEGAANAEGAADDEAPEKSFIIEPRAEEPRLIILCDHAGNALPERYGSLGLGKDQFARHIAYDIGAAPVAREIGRRLGATVIATRYSRLLIDPNRGLDDPTLVMQLSDGAVVPGNRGITRAELERRIRLYWRPYHEAIDKLIDARLAGGVVPVLLSIHSFTERWKGAPRPWHVTVLWDRDPRFARPLLERLGRQPDLVVGENEPYSGALEGDCLNRHGTRRGLAHALIEIRQDLIREPHGQKEWGARLAAIVGELLADPALSRQFAEVWLAGAEDAIDAIDAIDANDRRGATIDRAPTAELPGDG